MRIVLRLIPGFVLLSAGLLLQGSAQLVVGGLGLALTVLGLERVWSVVMATAVARNPATDEAGLERRASKIALGILTVFFWAGTLLLAWVVYEGYRPGSHVHPGSIGVQVFLVALTLAAGAYATLTTAQWRRALQGDGA